MVTAKDILQATPLWQEITEYREKVGEERGRREALERGLEQGRRQELLNSLTLVIQAQIPGHHETAWLERIGDLGLLRRILRDLLMAPNAESARAVLARFLPQQGVPYHTVVQRIIESIAELKSLAGQEVGVSDWLTMSQDRISRFADVSEDHQWIHLDAARAAAESPYKTTVAHGFLTLSLLSEFSRQAVEIRGDFARRINYGINRLRFPAPVPAGSRIRGRFALHSVEDIEGGVQVIWNATVEVEGGVKPALAAEWITRLYY